MNNEMDHRRKLVQATKLGTTSLGLSTLCLFSGLLTSAETAHDSIADTTSQIHSSVAGGFLVKWKSKTQNHSTGNQIEVFRVTPRFNSQNLSETTIYSEYIPDLILSVSSWNIPNSELDRGESGILICTAYGLGSDVHYMILAKTKNGFGKVFNVSCNKMDSGRELEVVDINGDTIPEIISTNYRSLLGEAQLKSTRSKIWQWDENKQRYTIKRECLYKDRLKP